ncbi:DNA primase [Streptomyces sp. NPDC007851]|uniref:DNA primase n=1 Tax=Streptomyces sp. NPDC007851 TaxID=3155008 RepID=UPI0033C3777D
MNRMGLGLAIGAGYLLGRTKKLKMALAMGSIVAGKRLNLGPKQLMELANQQLRDNPQFKEIGDQLRQDLRGVGKAASGAMVQRQLDSLADRLHGRTAQVRDQLAGVVPDTGDLGVGGGRDDEDAADDYDEAENGGTEDAEARSDEAEDDEAEDDSARDESDDAESRREKAPAKKAAKKAPAKQAAAKKTPAKKAPAKKAPAKKVAQGRAAAKKTAGRTRPKGGGDR